MTIKWSSLPVIVTLMIVGILVTAIVIIGSPTTERLKRQDIQRLNALDRIRFQGIDAYYQRNKTLPENLEILMEQEYLAGQEVSDPWTGVMYDYHVISTSTYELCATFSLSSTDLRTEYVPMQFPHAAGPACERYTYDSQLKTFQPASIDKMMLEKQIR